MLTIHYGDVEGAIYNTSTFFNNTYSPEWFTNELAQRMIKSVDGSIVLGPNACWVSSRRKNFLAALRRFCSCCFCRIVYITHRTAGITARIGFSRSPACMMSQSACITSWTSLTGSSPFGWQIPARSFMAWMSWCFSPPIACEAMRDEGRASRYRTQQQSADQTAHSQELDDSAG